MSPRTVFLSRLIGLYCVLCAVAMMIHKPTFVETVTALLHNAPVMFILGVFTLVAGLAMVLLHNIWSGGPAPVIVTLIGWITLAKGLLFLFLPSETEADFFLQGLHYQQLFYVYAGISLVIGVYLTYCGFKASSHS